MAWSWGQRMAWDLPFVMTWSWGQRTARSWGRIFVEEMGSWLREIQPVGEKIMAHVIGGMIRFKARCIGKDDESFQESCEGENRMGLCFEERLKRISFPQTRVKWKGQHWQFLAGGGLNVATLAKRLRVFPPCNARDLDPDIFTARQFPPSVLIP
eukprot:3994482-Ditylum_brightwellii.AAC.1